MSVGPVEAPAVQRFSGPWPRSRAKAIFRFTSRFRTRELPSRILGLWLESLEAFTDEQLQEGFLRFHGHGRTPSLDELISVLNSIRRAPYRIIDGCEKCDQGLVRLRDQLGYEVLACCDCDAGLGRPSSLGTARGLLERGYSRVSRMASTTAAVAAAPPPAPTRAASS